MRIERQVLFWLAALIALALAVLALKDVLLPFVAGLVIAYALNPLTERLVRWGLSRTLASAVVVAFVVVALVLALLFLVPPLISQLQQLVHQAPAELERLKALVEAMAKERLGARFEDFRAGLDKAVTDLVFNSGAFAAALARSAWSQGLAIVNFISLLLITPLVVFYLLVDWHPMLKKIDGWLPREHEPTIRRLAGEIDGDRQPGGVESRRHPPSRANDACGGGTRPHTDEQSLAGGPRRDRRLLAPRQLDIGVNAPGRLPE